MWIFEILREMVRPSTMLEALGNCLTMLIAIGLVVYGVFLLTLIGV